MVYDFKRIRDRKKNLSPLPLWPWPWWDTVGCVVQSPGWASPQTGGKWSAPSSGWFLSARDVAESQTLSVTRSISIKHSFISGTKAIISTYMYLHTCITVLAVFISSAVLPVILLYRYWDNPGHTFPPRHTYTSAPRILLFTNQKQTLQTKDLTFH